MLKHATSSNSSTAGTIPDGASTPAAVLNRVSATADRNVYRYSLANSDTSKQPGSRRATVEMQIQQFAAATGAVEHSPGMLAAAAARRSSADEVPRLPEPGAFHPAVRRRTSEALHGGLTAKSGSAAATAATATTCLTAVGGLTGGSASRHIGLGEPCAEGFAKQATAAGNRRVTAEQAVQQQLAGWCGVTPPPAM